MTKRPFIQTAALVAWVVLGCGAPEAELPDAASPSVGTVDHGPGGMVALAGVESGAFLAYVPEGGTTTVLFLDVAGAPTFLCDGVPGSPIKETVAGLETALLQTVESVPCECTKGGFGCTCPVWHGRLLGPESSCEGPSLSVTDDFAIVVGGAVGYWIVERVYDGFRVRRMDEAGEWPVDVEIPAPTGSDQVGADTDPLGGLALFVREPPGLSRFIRVADDGAVTEDVTGDGYPGFGSVVATSDAALLLTGSTSSDRSLWRAADGEVTGPTLLPSWEGGWGIDYRVWEGAGGLGWMKLTSCVSSCASEEVAPFFELQLLWPTETEPVVLEGGIWSEEPAARPGWKWATATDGALLTAWAAQDEARVLSMTSDGASLVPSPGWTAGGLVVGDLPPADKYFVDLAVTAAPGGAAFVAWVGGDGHVRSRRAP